MPVSVTDAFKKFLKEVVELDPDDAEQARRSRELLVEQLHHLPGEEGLFPLLLSGKHVPYGAFARGTKIRPLDDLDLMICLHGESATFQPFHNRVEISVPQEAARLRPLCIPGTHLLDSRRVLVAFAKHLERLPDFYLSEVKRTGEAVSLWLGSYTWHFDLVPSFCMQEGGSEGKSYMLMPDRYGHWKRSDPGMDNKRLPPVIEQHGSQVLPLIRILKYWRLQFHAPDFTAYLLECIAVRFFGEATAPVSPLVDVALPYIFHYLSRVILQDLPDPKGLKPNINHLNGEERKRISERAALDALRAVRARELERDGLIQASIQKWSGIFGDRFPQREDW